MTAPAQYDVFLSHNHRQKTWVRGVVALLRQYGLRVFFDEDSISPGEDVVRALERAIESSEVLVLVLSRSSVFSRWVAFETAIRLYEDPDTSLRRLIPVLVEPVDRTMIRPAVRRLDAVDLTDPINRQAEFNHFLRSLGLGDVPASELPPWPDASAVEELCVADIASVTSWGWSGEQLLERLINLDYQVLSELTAEHEGHAAQWAPVFMDHPDSWRLLATPDRSVVGYWHFVPLFSDDFSQAMRGELQDSAITTDRVQLFELPGTYPVYFVTLCLLPNYRRKKALALLLASLFDVLAQLASDGIFIGDICTNAFSDSGVAMCKAFGLSWKRPHRDHGQIFVGSMSEVLDSVACRDYGALREAYALHSLRLGDQQQVRAPVAQGHDGTS